MELNGRTPSGPLATDSDGVPDGLLIVGCKTSRSGQTEFSMQKVGYPAIQPTWHDEDTVKERWPREYERHQLNHADFCELMDGEESQLVAIVGHRLNGERSARKRIQLSCQWENNTETWRAEDEVQRKHNAAVLTYWQSDTKARRFCKVSDHWLRVLGHENSRAKLFLKVQMVGRSSCDGCAVCGNRLCEKSSICAPNTPWEPVERLLLKWPEATAKYLESQGLSSYNAKPKVKRRSGRLQCGKDLI